MTAEKNQLILFSYRRCPFAIRVRMVLEEKGLPFLLKEEKLSDLSEELLSLHPEGRVPLLIHEKKPERLVLYQSNIITEYLEEEFPEKPLMPREPDLRAQIRLWTYWCDTLFKPDLDLFKYELKKLDAQAADELIQRIHGWLKQVNEALGRSEYLAGDQMTLADIHLFPFFRQFSAITAGRDQLGSVAAYKNLTLWLEKMVQRPAFLRVMSK